MEKGIEKGMEKGIEKGKMQGMELMAELIQHLNEESLSMEEIASKFQVEIEQVLWVKKLLDK
jgi:predicted transposase YdaD